MDSSLKSLILISVAAALGDEKGLKVLLAKTLEGSIDLTSIEEVFLQTALFAGVPRALNGFRLLSDALEQLTPEQKKKHLDAAQSARTFSIEDPESSGADLFAQVYGEENSSLREILASRHPVLEAWIIKRAYGEILSRPALSLRIRELCAVAVLVALNLPLQLWGHLKGALRQGVSPEEIQELLLVIDSQTPHTSIASEMLTRLESS